MLKIMAIFWIPYLIFYIYWLSKKKPYSQLKTYDFPLCKFLIKANLDGIDDTIL